MKIMTVDDNKRIRDVIKSKLVELKGEFSECENDDSVLALYRSFYPDRVMMDAEMDGMDGITVTRDLSRSDSRAKGIVVTNYDDRNSARCRRVNNEENSRELEEIMCAKRTK